MVVSDIIVFGLSNTYIKEPRIDDAEIIQGKRITDFYYDEYPFLSAYEGVVYQITPYAREEHDYGHEFLDISEDSSMRIIWIKWDLKKKLLGIVLDMLAEAGTPVVFLAHLQGYEQRKVHLNLSAFEKELMNESLVFNTAYVISKD